MGTQAIVMTDFVIPLSSLAATDAECVGPKAANLAALGRAGLPTPGGFCLTADAYRHQIASLGLAEMVRDYGTADLGQSRRLSIAIRLGLYEKPIAPEILEPLLEAWRRQQESGVAGVVRSSALIEDRASASFAGQFESFLGLERAKHCPLQPMRGTPAGARDNLRESR
jgi:pyruvate,water dikinase